jgi:hypothetical protein
MPVIPEWILDEARYRWERMAIREKINSIELNKMYIITGVSVFILLLVTIVLLWPGKKQEVVNYKKAWYYDQNTNKLFLARATEESVTEAPSRPLPDGTPAGVKAYVYSYVINPKESDRIIGFLWKQVGPGQSDKWDKGKVVKKPEDKEWVAADSKKGKQIVGEVLKQNKDGIYPISCPPVED